MEFESEVQEFVNQLLTEHPISDLNRKYLGYLKHVQKYEPAVIYDIGSSIGAYTKFCHLLFPNSKVILFEADDYFIPRYNNEDYHIACLSDTDGLEIKFYNESLINNIQQLHSCYKSDYLSDNYKILMTKTLDKLVSEKSIPLPNIVKISCCGSEMDIIKGGEDTIKNCKYLIISLQNDNTFKEAPKADIVGPYIISLGFKLEEVLDSYGTKVVDYVFINKNI